MEDNGSQSNCPPDLCSFHYSDMEKGPKGKLVFDSFSFHLGRSTAPLHFHPSYNRCHLYISSSDSGSPLALNIENWKKIYKPHILQIPQSLSSMRSFRVVQQN